MVSGSDRIRQLISAAVLVAGLLPLAAVAQSTNATLDGTIRDDQGGVLPGATVTAINESNGLTRSITTGERELIRLSGELGTTIRYENGVGIWRPGTSQSTGGKP